MQAIRHLSVVLAAAGLAACSDPVTRIGADWGCSPVEGVSQLLGAHRPRFILVGEFTETNEGPAAFAEIACNMARAGNPLFVGVSEYFGGMSDAETGMRQRLDALVAKGAPITVGVVGEQGREFNPRARDTAENHWAQSIEQKFAASGAKQALILVARSDASLAPVGATVRSAAYDPMPMHLDGDVVSLEIAAVPGLGADLAVRLYPAPRDGFHGQLALASLTRPAIALVLPATLAPLQPGSVLPPPTNPEEDAKFFLRMKEIELEARKALALPIPPPLVDLPEFAPPDTP